MENGRKMRILIDTNIILEMLLEQAKASAARQLLSQSTHEFFVTDFAIHSIGLLFFRQKKYRAFEEFIDDLLKNSYVAVKSLSIDDLGTVSSDAQKFNLDFDDAYQYVAAKKYDLTLVSFDRDFDRTERGRKTPAEILEAL
ncbi:VapC toxin family PIN domain ribonuclease [candidate division KSB1 bacterium 4484_188]|nr:MAG: VapC toxin family PIN domain ribonuclease [candidate division KSB1 bacterium 4484_188]